ncbi:MAG: hypothetical protein P8Y10_02540 [Gemmatimonadales bacterium]|jgi:hypothetical protein
MKLRLSLAVGLGALLLPLAAFAQEEQPALFATYYYCDQAREARTDTLVSEHVAPIYDRHLAAGDITAWGWLSHRIGGKWRRLEYYTSPTRDVLLTTRAALLEELDGDDALDEFTEICPSHDDYIWNYEGGSDPGLSRPEFAISMYFECDFAREDMADDIYLNVFDDVLDQAVADGTITGWSWLSHDVGGKYRRIAVIDGTGVNAVLNARDAIFDQIAETMGSPFQVFSETCNSHTDYVWDVEMSKP